MNNEILAKLRYGNAPSWFIEMANMHLNIADDKIKEEQRGQYEHTILFMPVCGNCGAFINATVDVKRETYDGTIGFSYSKVEPGFCKKCNTFLNSIVMPKDFPFPGYFREEY